MTAGRMDHRFWRNRAVRSLRVTEDGRAALGLWCIRWSWLLDARDPDGEVFRDALEPEELPLAELLVVAGLWTRTDNGYRMANFEKFTAKVRPLLDRQAVFARDAWTCTYCGAALRLGFAHVDHIVPVSRGGTDDLANLSAACPPCNLQKGAKSLEEWRS